MPDIVTTLRKKYHNKDRLWSTDDDRTTPPPTIYKWVDSALSTWVKNKDEEGNIDLKRCSPRSDKLIIWSVELWFTEELLKCKRPSAEEYMKMHSKELFHEVFDPLSNPDSCFEVLTEKEFLIQKGTFRHSCNSN